MTHSCTADPEEAAVRIAEALTRRAVRVEQQLLAADIRILARDPSGPRHLEQALTSYDDDEVTIMVRALIHQTAADLTCEADQFLHQVCVWSIFWVAAGSAGASMLLAAISVDPTWRLNGLAFATAVFAGVGLAIVGLAARRRKGMLAEAAAMHALLATDIGPPGANWGREGRCWFLDSG